MKYDYDLDLTIEANDKKHASFIVRKIAKIPFIKFNPDSHEENFNGAYVHFMKNGEIHFFEVEDGKDNRTITIVKEE
jgi:hypothetical protein